MTNIARLSATAALVTVALSAFAPPPPTTQVCVGPETPDDAEDFVDVDTVVHPDAACRVGNALFVFLPVTGPVPAIGEELGSDSPVFLAYRSRVPTAFPTSRRPTTRPAAPSTQRPAAPTTAPRPAPAPTRAPSVASRPSSAPVPAPRPAPAPRAQQPAPPAARPAPAAPAPRQAPAPRPASPPRSR